MKGHTSQGPEEKLMTLEPSTLVYMEDTQQITNRNGKDNG